MRYWRASTVRPTRPRHQLRRCLSGVAVAALLALASTGAVARGDATVAVRSGLHDGYARLVFDWPKPVRFEASLNGSQLVVRFDEALTVDAGAAALRKLDGYLAHPTLAPDHRSISFDLVRAVGLKSFQNEHSAVIDLVDQPAGTPMPAAAAASPAAPAPVAAAPVAAAPVAAPPADAHALPVPVRVGEHDDFTRLRFDWPQSVDYRVDGDAGRVTIAFTKPAQIDLAALRNALPRAIAEPALSADGKSLSFNVPRTAQLHHFRSGLSVVLDVTGSPNATPVAAAAPVAPTPPSPPAAPVAAAPAQTPDQTPAPAAPATAAAAPPAPAAAPTAATPGSPSLGIAANAAPAAPDVRAPEIKPVVEGPTVVVTHAGGRVRIGWRQPPAAALFARGGAVYMLFDKPAKFDLSAFNPNTKKPVDRMTPPEVLDVEGGSGLRFTVAPNQSLQPARENDAWVVTVRNEVRRPQYAATVTIEAASTGGPSVAVSMSGAESLLNFTDPERGDALRIVPVRTAGLGVDPGRQFAQFDVVPSLQGLVVASRADGVALRQTATSILVGDGQGLVVSRASGPARRGVGAVFDFQRWLDSDVDYNETRQGLQRADAEAVMTGDPMRLATARFELAQFFLARGHAADAAGMLDLIAADNPRYAVDPQLKALRGAARVMLDEGRGAKADLGDASLDGDGAVSLWRGAAAGLLGKWAEADQAFRRGGQVPSTYPADMRQHLLLLAAEAALENGDSARTRTLLDNLMRGNVPARIATEADYLRARALIAADDRKSALPILQRLASSADPWARAHGEFLLVDQQLADSAITPAQAIDRLDKLRFVWNGNTLEYRLLRRLGDLELQYGDVRAGLSRLREAMEHFPDHQENAAVRAQMVDAFAGVYDESGPRKLPPLTALALYDDFRDLTPPGARGDAMIQNLADRLVQMDLLDRAGELLDYQIKNRLQGTDKARVGARLAVVRLLDRQPKAAITALDDSDQPKLPPELTAERLHLRARALAETGDASGALALLEGDTGRDADQIRAEIFVKGQSWGKAAQVLDRLIGDPTQGAFDAARRRQVLNLAVAYALAGDAEGLRSVRDRFGDKMNSGATKDAFNLVTSITEGGAITDAALSARFADLQEFQQFMKGYQEKLRSTNLSAIN